VSRLIPESLEKRSRMIDQRDDPSIPNHTSGRSSSDPLIDGGRASSKTVNVGHQIYSTWHTSGTHTYLHSLRVVMAEFQWTEEQAMTLFPKANFTDDLSKVDCRACVEAIHA
jgi:hypothetical protein